MKPSELPHQVRHHITNIATTVNEVLKTHFSLSEDEIARLFLFGALYQNKKRILEDRPLEKGEYLRVHLKPKRFPVHEINWNERSVFENREFLIVDKPPGIPMIPTVDNRIENVLQQMREATDQNLLVTQRIDVPVGGLCVLAKTGRFQEWFNRYLAERKVDKYYRALVQNPMTSGRKVHYMEPSDRAPKVVCAEEKPEWQKCELTVNLCEKFSFPGSEEKLYEILLQLHTGRTHQIRTQLSFLKSPILGDRMYGSPTPFPTGESAREQIGLACVKLAFKKGSDNYAWELAPHWRQ